MDTPTTFKGIVIFAVTFGCFALAKPARESHTAATTDVAQQPTPAVSEPNGDAFKKPAAGTTSSATGGQSEVTQNGAAPINAIPDASTQPELADDLKIFFDHWVSASLQNDPSALAAFYADNLTAYHGRKNLDRLQMEAIQKDELDTSPISRLSLTDRRFLRTPTGAVMVSAHEDVSRQTAEGSVRQTVVVDFVLLDQSDGWKITSEQESD